MTNSFHHALQLHQIGNLASAKEIYNKILIDNPDNVEVLHLLAILHSQEQNFLKAAEFIEQALTKESSPTLHNNAGNIYKNLQQIDRAIFHYQKSLSLKPNAAAHNNLGIIYYNSGQLNKATEHYQAALALNHLLVDAYFNLGLIAQIQQKLSLASSYFSETLKLKPQHTEAHYQLASIAQQENDLDTAIKHYHKVLKIDHNHIKAHYNLGVLLINKGKLNPSIRHFKKILSNDPNHQESYHNLGVIFLKQNKPEIALKYFLRLSQLTKNFDSYYNLGTIYLDLGKLQDAIIYFHEALKLKPENLETCINLAGIYLRKRDENNAIKYYEQVLKINPHNEEAKYLIAALKSENLSIAPTQYVQHLFDNYANHFDQHLQLLKYKVPEEIYNEIIKILGKEIKNLVILDFGCGTGLAGEKFSLHADKIIGIDLSERMLEIAKQKNIYDELKMGNENDIINYPHIDLIIAADTFVYIGDLDKMFANCRKILKLGGLLAFTTEQTDHYPYLLQKTARFAHSISYLNELSIKNNFTILINKNIIARTNEGNEVKCNLFIVKILTH